MYLNSHLRSSRLYFLATGILLLASAALMQASGKVGSFHFLNSYHTYLLDNFFKYYTHIGDGLFALFLIAVVFFYFKKKQQGFALLYSFLISGLIAQVLKRLFVSPRPASFFEPGQYLYFIEGVNLAKHASFPSGHTATAFALATVLAMTVKNRNTHLPILLLAALAGYSRIYLAQHFLTDVLAGAVIGVLSGILSVYMSEKIKWGRTKKSIG